MKKPNRLYGPKFQVKATGEIGTFVRHAPIGETLSDHEITLRLPDGQEPVFKEIELEEFRE